MFQSRTIGPLPRQRESAIWRETSAIRVGMSVEVDGFSGRHAPEAGRGLEAAAKSPPSILRESHHVHPVVPVVNVEQLKILPSFEIRDLYPLVLSVPEQTFAPGGDQGMVTAVLRGLVLTLTALTSRFVSVSQTRIVASSPPETMRSPLGATKHRSRGRAVWPAKLRISRRRGHVPQTHCVVATGGRVFGVHRERRRRNPRPRNSGSRPPVSVRWHWTLASQRPIGQSAAGP